MVNHTRFDTNLVGTVFTHGNFSWFPVGVSWEGNVRMFYSIIKKSSYSIHSTYEIVRQNTERRKTQRCVQQDQTASFSFSPAAVGRSPISLFDD